MSQASPDIKALVDQGFSCWNGDEIDLMANDYADDVHEQWDAWDHLRMDPLDVADVGGGRYVVEIFPSRDAALEAAGPAE